MLKRTTPEPPKLQPTPTACLFDHQDDTPAIRSLQLEFARLLDQGPLYKVDQVVKRLQAAQRYLQVHHLGAAKSSGADG